MREIIFRGLDINTGEMIYGDYERSIEAGDNGGVEHLYQETSIELKYITANSEANTVYPDTVGQYTGINDHNKVKIFEGDIVEYDDRETCKPPEEVDYCTGEVVFSEGAWWINYSLGHKLLYSETAKLTVIGNIHEGENR